MLEISGLSVDIAGRQVLRDISLTVAPSEIVALIGHNGAGKTTLLRAVMGLQRPVAGGIGVLGRRVRFGGTEAVAKAGIALVPQGRNVFRPLSVAENLAIARSASGSEPLPDQVVFELFPALRDRLAAPAGSLSGGQQQMLGLAAALLRRPRLIMLDEPSTGLAPLLVADLFRAVAILRRDHGIGFLIVDQNVAMLLGFAGRAYVLKSGQIAYSGPAAGLADSATLWSMF